MGVGCVLGDVTLFCLSSVCLMCVLVIPTISTPVNISQGPQCNADQFQCSTGECISYKWQVCNGWKECPNGGDELNCHLKNCTEDQFPCKDDVCIAAGHQCDGDRDCPGGDDENYSLCDYYYYECGEDEFDCGSWESDAVKCIPMSDVCNGVANCDETVLTSEIYRDEQGCADYPCGEDRFKCYMSDGVCVPNTSLCDMNRDCPMGEDEAGCPCDPRQYLFYFRCNDYDALCIWPSDVCDGWEGDCWEDEDEQHCVCSNSLHEYRCQSGQCIPLAWHCDGYWDCVGGLDEINCTTPRPELPNIPPSVDIN